MYYHRKIWKEIPYEEYRELTKDKTELQIVLENNVKRDLDYSKLVPNTGEGICNYINRVDEENKKEHSPEDYKYYITDGYETISVLSARFIKEFNQIFINEANQSAKIEDKRVKNK